MFSGVRPPARIHVLSAAGHSIHLSELKLPKGVEVVSLMKGGEDQAVATILAPRGGAGEAEAEGEKPAA